MPERKRSVATLAGTLFLDGLQVGLGDGHGRNHAGGVTGVNAGKFHVFHHGRNVNVFAVGKGVGFAFQGVVEETIDEQRASRSHAHGVDAFGVNGCARLCQNASVLPQHSLGTLLATYPRSIFSS